MPLTIPDKLPAIKILEEENIFVMRKDYRYSSGYPSV